MSGVAGASFAVALAACVGGPGRLPDPDTDRRQQQQGGETVITVEPGPTQGSSGGGSSSTGDTGGGGAGSSSGTSGTGGSSGTPGSGGGSGAVVTKPPPTIEASEFDRTCSQPSDCAAVYTGAACQPCRCPNAAIATRDRSKYESTVADRSEECPPAPDVACSPCPTVTATCSGNQCTVVAGAAPGG
jgi:hypothetical protein